MFALILLWSMACVACIYNSRAFCCIPIIACIDLYHSFFTNYCPVIFSTFTPPYGIMITYPSDVFLLGLCITFSILSGLHIWIYPQYTCALLSSTLSVYIISCTNDLFNMFLGLELMFCSILYILSKQKLNCREFVLWGSVLSALLLIIIIYIYGETGTFMINNFSKYTPILFIILCCKIGIFGNHWLYIYSSSEVFAYLLCCSKINVLLLYKLRHLFEYFEDIYLLHLIIFTGILTFRSQYFMLNLSAYHSLVSYVAIIYGASGLAVFCYVISSMFVYYTVNCKFYSNLITLNPFAIEVICTTAFQLWLMSFMSESIILSLSIYKAILLYFVV